MEFSWFQFLCIVLVFFRSTSHFNQVFALWVNWRQFNCFGDERWRFGLVFACSLDCSLVLVEVLVVVVVVLACLRVNVGVILGVPQLVMVPGLLDKSGAVVLTLLPQG